MNTSTILIDATRELENDLSNDSALVIASTRVIKLLGRALAGLKDNPKGAIEFAALSDDELMRQLAISLAVSRSAVDERELDRQMSLVEGTQKFFNMLKKQGGTAKAGVVAQKLGVTRQTVNNQLKAGKLLAIRFGGDYLFPLFQFDDKGKLAHFEDILMCLPNVSPVTKCGFFTASLQGRDETVIDMLRRGVNQQELAIILQQARLYLEHVAK
ncbi:TPA: DNA-binding protein [Yersinia enterocolitica]|uniref:DNA-binding protein n=1 Tax=Yersinia enterocolitica TaxID=630 RepID=UPI002AC43E35|nr:DNA-binding protein [Yersinia enterocolitica]HDM8438163.1 DNA-binding protein [Yersinia enterocolitica]HEN3623721.1 DNA-binding protein [Yersinia enterocolitica]